MATLGGVKLVLGDSCPLFQIGFEVSMAKEGFEVAAFATSHEDLSRLCTEFAPNAVVTSLFSVGSYPSIDKIRNMIKACGGVSVVVLTHFSDADLVKSLYQAGVSAVVNKSSPPSLIAESIRHAIAGDVYFPPDIAQQLALATARGGESPRTLLNEREQDVLAKIAVGMTLSDIATALALSLRTVSQLSTTIKYKLGIRRPVEFTIYALKHRFIDIQDLEHV